jgi:hypothetical protein
MNLGKRTLHEGSLNGCFLSQKRENRKTGYSAIAKDDFIAQIG